MHDAGLLAEQMDYYCRRAPDYDQWWQRTGPYDRGERSADRWRDEVAEVAAALEALGRPRRVLELAGGTGWWTERLAGFAEELTVLDSSHETLALNRARVRREDVAYLVADVFDWEPRRRHAYDLVFFSFWLSHVPRDRFEGFWSLVGSCLAPGGRVFLVDNLGPEEDGTGDPHVVDEEHDVQRRRLRDGSEHRVVKVFYAPGELHEELVRLGWEGEVCSTETSFLYATVTRPE